MNTVKIIKDGKTYLLGKASGAHKLEGWEVPADKRRHLLAGARPVSPSSWRGIWQSLKLESSALLSDPEIQKTLQHALNNNQLAVRRQHVLPTKTQETGSQGKSPSGPTAEAEPVAAKDTSTSLAPAAGSTSAPVDSVEPAKTNPESDTGAAPEEATETRGCPISMVSGEELLTLVDAELPGPLPFQWQRTYRSSQRRDIGLGISWTHSACEQLVLGNHRIEFYDSEGRILPLARPRVGQTSRYLPEGIRLLHPSENHFILQQKGQPDKVFARIGASEVCRLIQLRHSGYKAADSTQSASGFAIDLHYNAHNRLVRVAGNWGQSLVIDRDTAGRVQHVDLLNEGSGHCKRVAHYSYNAIGELISQRNANGVGEDYIYTHHLLQQRSLATGFRYYYEWDATDASARCTRNWGDDGIYDYKFEWAPANNTSRATDSRGYTTTFKYNEYGLITEEIDNEGALHQYRYEHGRKVAYINPLGHETRYFYDTDMQALGHRDALGHQESLAYFKGQLTRYTDKTKACWQNEYNAQGQLAARIDPYGQRTEYRYNKVGLLAEVRAPGKRTTRYKWRDDGYLHRLTDSEGHVREFHYDDWGQVTEVELRLKGQILAGKQQYTYTPSGRLASITNAQGKTSSYCYNNNDQLIQYRDAQGRSTHFEYDGLSQVVKRIDAEGHSLHYEYDKERNLIGLINENGERYRFEYDGNERLMREIGFDGREQGYDYDAAGQLVQHIDAGEIVTNFERDALGRMLKKISRHLKNPEQEELSRYAYDAMGRIRECYNGHHYLEFDYNPSGKIVREHTSELNDKKQRINASKRDINYRYAWPGLRSLMQLPDGQEISYAYDDSFQLSAIHRNNQEITRIQRDEFGREIARQQGALTSESEYDPHSRLQKQIAYNRNNKSQKPIERHYGYDDFGNLNQITDGPVETRYVYDLLNRLKLSESTVGEKTEQEIFHFDPAGNRLEKSANKNTGNRLSFMGDRKFTYDARGNLTKEHRGKEGKIETRYHYNLNNQLIKVEKGKQTTEYRYDPLGRRTQKRDEFGSTHYLWAGDQLVQEERLQIRKTYIFEPESFKPVAMVQDENIYHYHLDHLGTPQELSANDGNIVWKARYKTYGNVAVKEVEDVENNLRFQGQYFDEETGLHYNRHRYYDPSAGQFTSQDPIGLLGGVNNYQYAANPISWIDPFGLSCKEKYSCLKEMDYDYRGEELGYAKAWADLPFDVEVEYLMSEAERAQYEVFVKGGLLHDSKGKLLDTGDAKDGKFIFVMDPQGRIFAGAPRLFEFHHSSFFAGGDVASAGEIEVASGLLLMNDNNSGHYKPSDEHNDQFIQELKDRGLDGSKTRKSKRRN